MTGILPSLTVHVLHVLQIGVSQIVAASVCCESVAHTCGEWARLLLYPQSRESHRVALLGTFFRLRPEDAILLRVTLFT